MERFGSFNISHVTLYRCMSLIQTTLRKSFNTSHVTLYRCRWPVSGVGCCVSIHLMLLFIGCPNRTHSGHYGLFNTSHVTLYRKRAVSISAVLWFQYISCYSLSEDRDRNCKKVQAFQYISCYSLSHFLIFLADRSFVSIHLMLLFISIVSAIPSAASLFQYISCYSLSECNASAHRPVERFNTSHVTLYLISKKLLLLVHISFNTSHVTLYPKLQRVSFPPTVVSIHLMLLFIGEHFNGQDVTITFQYISCYSLSPGCLEHHQHPWMFQYISCYSLSHSVPEIRNSSNVSIHLMLLFIVKETVIQYAGNSFNTSHVTLYLAFLTFLSYQLPFQYISCYSLSFP